MSHSSRLFYVIKIIITIILLSRILFLFILLSRKLFFLNGIADGRQRSTRYGRAPRRRRQTMKKTGSASGPTTSACSATRTAQHSAGGFLRVSCVLVRVLRIKYSSANIIILSRYIYYNIRL